MRRFTNILYFADHEVEGKSGLERAVALARSNAAPLTVIDVLPKARYRRQKVDLEQQLLEHREAELERQVARYAGISARIRVTTGVPSVEVIRAVLRDGHDLLIKDAKSMAGSKRLLSSIDQRLLRKCPCPVWLDRPAAPLPYRSILAAVDPLEENGAGCAPLVMDLATSLARREQARLAVVHAWRLPGETMWRSGFAQMPRSELDDLLEETRGEHAGSLNALLEPYGLSTESPDVHLLKGDPAEVIRDLRQRLRSDVIVMGTLGRAGIAGFFIGNTAEEVLQTTPASILAVKPPGFVSPVTAE